MSKKIKKYHNSFIDRERVKTKIRIRLMVLSILWILGFGIIIARLVFVQVFEHEKLTKEGDRVIKNQEIPAQRGTIYDRNGKILAVDLINYSLGAFPDKLLNKTSAARKISQITNTSFLEILSKMKSTENFAYLAHRLRPQQAEDIRKLRLEGLVLEKKYSRYYPFEENGAHLIGYCDFDNVARAGIELEYDNYLRGLNGHCVYLRDAKGSRFPDLNYPLFNPINGKDVYTTLDIVLQSILEEELRRGVNDHEALNGSAVLLDVRSNEILGLANFPGFDPNNYNRFPIKNYRNIAISDQFEPGSTFKIIALAMALEQLKLDLNSNKIYCENGQYTFFKRTIHDHKKFGNLTIKEIFENSSNIGTIKLARRFDAPVFYRYARDFGFGTLTGIDLPAESAGILHKPDEFSSSSAGYMSIGYEVAVTPLQIACAYAAIANGGNLFQSYIVNSVLDEDGRLVLANTPQIIRRVISAQTAVEMKSTLHGVVENGTGQSARIQGISIAGKTGTAQKVNHEKNQYVDKYISSFVGFFPVESPRFVLLIMINEPKGEYYGSQVAAPVFRNIVQRIIGLPENSKLAVAPTIPSSNHQESNIRELSNVESNISKTSTPDYKIIRASQKISQNHIEQPLIKVSDQDEKIISRNKVPRFIGLTLREALEKLSKFNLDADFEGNGVVDYQSPRPGAKLNPQTKIKLVFKSQ